MYGKVVSVGSTVFDKAQEKVENGYFLYQEILAVGLVDPLDLR